MERREYRQPEGIDEVAASDLSAMNNAESALAQADMERRRDEIGELAELPTTHPAVIEHQRAKQRYEQRKQVEKQLAREKRDGEVEARRSPRKTQRAQQEQREQEGRSDREAVEVLNREIDAVAHDMRKLGLLAQRVGKEVGGRFPPVARKARRLERLLRAVHKGLGASKITANRMREE